MAIHDAYARLTPYELLLPDPDFPDRCFPAIGEEAVERGVDPGNPAAFVMLGAVQGALAELRTEDTVPEAAHDHGTVLYFAYHMWRTGAEIALVRANTMRDLLASSSREHSPTQDESWLGGLHARTGYIQLPQHLVWIEEGDGGGPGRNPTPEPPGERRSPPEPAPPPEDPGPAGTAPESVDGFFWAADTSGALHLALVSGMRPDRPGYGIVPVPPLPMASLPEWATGPAREGGADFTTSLPGAELDGLLGIRTPAEVFKLAALVLHRIARTGPAASPPGAAPASPAPGTGQPRDPASPAPGADQPRDPAAAPPGTGQPRDPAARPRDPSPRPSALPSVTL